jgi:hypothetical protein
MNFTIQTANQLKVRFISEHYRRKTRLCYIWLHILRVYPNPTSTDLCVMVSKLYCERARPEARDS